MEMSQRNNKEIDNEITRIDELICMAETMIINREKLEDIYKKAISQLFSSYKSTSRSRVILVKLHEIGRKRNYNFRCEIPFKDGEYWTECPVKLAHFPLPLGVSIGAATSQVCSICGEEPLDCNHIKGQMYDQVKCIMLENGYCNICLKQQCDHIEGQGYDNVQAVGMVTDLRFDHVAMVSNPLEPDAGITSIAIDRNLILTSALKTNYKFKWGDRLYCDHCAICKDC